MEKSLFALFLAAVGVLLSRPTGAQTVIFDFDAPGLVAGQGIPLLLTSHGVTALFSSPGGAVFSLQSDATTGFRLSRFSGLYLYPNSTVANALDIQFGQSLSGITLTFATADFQQVEVPTTVQLTAYQDSTGNTPVGSTTAHGTYAGDTMPMGTLSFTSAAPFNLVRLEIPYQAQAASGFLVDNIVVTPVPPTQAFRVRKHLQRAGP
jgi:hypothetical protein